jgi:CheY-like chemotaxis protein
MTDKESEKKHKNTGAASQAKPAETPPAAQKAAPDIAVGQSTVVEAAKPEGPSAIAASTEQPTTEAPKAELPKQESAAEPAAKTSTEKEAEMPAGSTSKTVLLVEDTMELAEILQVTLQGMGLTILHETHAAKALELFKTKKPNLILLDIGLPDMSGWKLLDGIKELGKEGRPHFIVITAYGDPANRLMGKLQDVDSYLIKPFSPEDVQRVVGKVLDLPMP